MIAIQYARNITGHKFELVLMGAAQAALAHQDVSEDTGLTIVLADDAQLQQLNQDYLGINTPTDVLSFPSGETDPDSGETYLGDILISLERADAQAIKGGHPLEQELELLVVHGVLHLLNYDHIEYEDRERMWAAQTEILESLGNPLNPGG